VTGEADPFDAVEAFFDLYLKAFYSGDAAAIDAVFEYPCVLGAGGAVSEIRDSMFYLDVLERFKAMGCVASRYESFRKFRSGQDGAMVLADYARLRADGSVINTSRGAYLLRHRPEGWKLVGMLDGGAAV
jgi:hypothetical protein